MKASKETYQNVAERCSSYERIGCSNCFCNANETSENGAASCLNCKHFAADEHCVLDLYDPIVANMK